LVSIVSDCQEFVNCLTTDFFMGKIKAFPAILPLLEIVSGLIPHREFESPPLRQFDFHWGCENPVDKKE